VIGLKMSWKTTKEFIKEADNDGFLPDSILTTSRTR
jgi:hypothetical protein